MEALDSSAAVQRMLTDAGVLGVTVEGSPIIGTTQPADDSGLVIGLAVAYFMHVAFQLFPSILNRDLASGWKAWLESGLR